MDQTNKVLAFWNRSLVIDVVRDEVATPDPQGRFKLIEGPQPGATRSRHIYSTARPPCQRFTTGVSTPNRSSRRPTV